MKKFRLKPLGELRHKFNMTWFFVSLVMALCVSACSDDDDNDIVPTFPEKQTINSNGNETRELAFDAAANWQLTSSAAWCRFVVDGVEEYSLSGNAGKQNITIQVTDEAQKFDARTTAQLTLTMGNTKAIIADVVRNAKGRELKIYDLEGNEIEAIKIGYKDYNSFVVKANFHFAATNRPEWVNIAGNAIVGSVSDKNGVVGKVKIIDDVKYVKYQQEGKITFADDEGLSSFDFPIVFDGMDRDKIEISGPNAWNWEVSLDGQTFTQTSSAGASGSTTSPTYNKFVPFTIQAYNDEFVPVYVTKVTEWGMTRFVIDSEEEPVKWMHLDGKNGNMRLTVDASSEEEREGYVLVFPKEVYDSVEDWWEFLIEMDPETYSQDIKYKYQEQNLVITFIQKQKKIETPDEQAFKVTYMDPEDNYATKELPCTKVTDSEILNMFEGVDDVYTMSQTVSSFFIDPFMDAEGYENTWNFVVMRDGKDVTNEQICEFYDGKISAWFEDSLNTELHLLIKEDGVTKKVLIITPNYN